MVKLKWLTSAKTDMKEIFDYIALDSKKYAISQILKIRQCTSILKKYPKAGKVIDEINLGTTREFSCGHYRIIYKIISKEIIHILLVHHGARAFPRSI